MGDGRKHSLDDLYLGQSPSNVVNDSELQFEELPVVYMNWMSPPSRAVMMVAAALGIPVKTNIISVLAGENRTPEYLEKNPQHTIPMYEEGEFRIWDSHAIAAYLVTSYGKTDELYPKDPRRRALVDQRLHFDSSTLFPSLLGAVYPLFLKQESSITDAAREKIESGLEILEMFLADQPCLAGVSVTIADLCCLATVTSLKEFVPESVEKFPNVIDWMENCKSLPYYEETNAVGVSQFGDMVRGLVEPQEEEEE